MDEYYIICLERDMFWKGNSNGYTDDISEAGRFTLNEAALITDSANIDDLQEMMVNTNNIRIHYGGPKAFLESIR